MALLATDIDREAVAQARSGEYPAAALKPVPEDLRRRYFEPVPGADGSRFVERVRRMVHFSVHNMQSDAPPGLFDLIFCRNVIIYFNKQTKDLLIEKLCRALVPGGLLLFDFQKYRLLPLDTEEHIYSKPGLG